MECGEVVVESSSVGGVGGSSEWRELVLVMVGSGVRVVGKHR